MRRTIALADLDFCIDDIPLPPYVGGTYDDSGPLMAVLWLDIRQAYTRNRIPAQESAMFELYIHGMALERIADGYKLKKSSAQRIIDRVKRKLERDSRIGMLTVIREELGWTGLREALRA